VNLVIITPYDEAEYRPVARDGRCNLRWSRETNADAGGLPILSSFVVAWLSAMLDEQSLCLGRPPGGGWKWEALR